MDMRRRSRQRLLMSKAPLFYCISICFFSICALFSTMGSSRNPCLDIRSSSSSSSSSGRKIDCKLQEIYNKAEEKRGRNSVSLRRYLSGPGSSPPRCTSKCGRCTPCKPVHVPVPPGTPVTTEYYPEAWRCKCGNKLFMP